MPSDLNAQINYLCETRIWPLSTDEPRFYYWESVECIRRLALSGGLVFISDGSVLQIFVGSLVALASLCVYAHVRPYEKEAVDSLAVTAQLIIFVQLFVALLIRTEVLQQLFSQNVILVLLFVTFFYVIGTQVIHFIIISSVCSRCARQPSASDATTDATIAADDAHLSALTEEVCRFAFAGAEVFVPRPASGDDSDPDSAVGPNNNAVRPASNAGSTTENVARTVHTLVSLLRRARGRLAAQKAQISAQANSPEAARPDDTDDRVASSSVSPAPGSEIEMAETHNDVESLCHVNPMHENNESVLL